MSDSGRLSVEFDEEATLHPEVNEAPAPGVRAAVGTSVGKKQGGFKSTYIDTDMDNIGIIDTNLSI